MWITLYKAIATSVGNRHKHVWEWIHDDVMKWKHFPRYWSFVRGIHRSLVNSPHKDQWRGVLMFSLSCVLINDWVNSREAGDLRRYRAHYDVIVMYFGPYKTRRVTFGFENTVFFMRIPVPIRESRRGPTVWVVTSPITRGSVCAI